MKPNLLKLHSERKAIIKYIDINKYPEIASYLGVSNVRVPTQILIKADGNPYETTKSEALGYKIIKDEEGNHIMTLHDGDLTYNEMKEILTEMGLK